MRTSEGRITVAGGVAIALCLTFLLMPLAGNASQARASGVPVVPSVMCSCASHIPGLVPAPMQFRGRGPPSSSSSYDEQIGLTFTQSFTSMEYNVTAVEQTDPTLGDGPAYLLSGVSDGGYWYQVGLSWNWAPGENPGTGFGMSYEVFDTSGNSIFPTGGQGGVLAFSGPVNAGDVVLLDLYFSNSSQSVVMLAEDTNTGAVASEVYPSMGATYFVGLPDSISDQNGFFTGLMTEWYHGEPYYANEAEVIYSNPSYKLTSAWMWIDEFNSNTFQGIFSANTSAPVSYSKPAKLQEFTFNGTTEYSDAYEFITGSLTNATRPTSSKVPLTLSFTVDGGGTGYSSPEFTYVSNGTSNTVQLNESPTVYQVDVGTEWNVTAQLTGSNSSERWETDQPTAALAISSLTMVFVYRNQYYVTFGFLVSGGGSGFSPPTIAYSSFGSSETTPADLGVWADAGSRYEYPSLLAGSKQNERWCANMDGYISSSRQIDATYYHQYQVEFDISFRNTQLFPGVPLSSTVAGRPYSATMVLGMNEEWLDSGSLYSVRQTLSLASGDRLMTNGTWTGTSSVNLVVSLTYVRQFYIGIMSNTSYGGSVSPASGWYDSGSKLSLDAVASPGWQFENWEGVGSDSASGSNTSLYLTVGPNTPASETALFYPGVTIYATGPMSVSYKDESVSGAIPGGATEVVYVPSSTLLNLATSSVAFWDSFQGWRGAINSSDASTSFTVDGPTTVTSTSGYNYAGIGVLSVVVLLVAIVGTFALRKRRLSQHDTREVAQSASGSTLSEASKQESVTQADDSRWWRTDSSIECCGKEITIRQLLEKTWS